MSVHETGESEVLSAASTAVVDADTDTDRLRVRGVLIGDGDLSRGMSGKPTRWPGSVLQDAADRDVFDGRPITAPQDSDPEQHVGVERDDDEGLRVDGSVPLGAKVGEIDRTVYREGEGLLFEGFIADDDAIDMVERGLAHVSPVMARSVGEPDDDGVYEATKILHGRDVGLLADGGIPSNDITPGMLAAMGSFYGDAIRGDDDPHDEAGGADGEGQSIGDGDGDSGNDTAETNMSDDDTNQLTDAEREVLRRMDRFDEPALIEQADADAYAAHEELFKAAAEIDDPVVVSESTYEALQSHVGTIDEALGAVLRESRGLKDTTVEAMSFEAKVAEFEHEEDGTIDLEALSQTPETGDPDDGDETGDGNGDDEPVSLESLSPDERSEVFSLASRARMLEGADAEYANELRAEAAEIAGADEWDALAEVL